MEPRKESSMLKNLLIVGVVLFTFSYLCRITITAIRQRRVMVWPMLTLTWLLVGPAVLMLIFMVGLLAGYFTNSLLLLGIDRLLQGYVLAGFGYGVFWLVAYVSALLAMTDHLWHTFPDADRDRVIAWVLGVAASLTVMGVAALAVLGMTGLVDVERHHSNDGRRHFQDGAPAS